MAHQVFVLALIFLTVAGLVAADFSPSPAPKASFPKSAPSPKKKSSTDEPSSPPAPSSEASSPTPTTSKSSPSNALGPAASDAPSADAPTSDDRGAEALKISSAIVAASTQPDSSSSKYAKCNF
ncbi:Uncharacterized protein Fot_35012 [Forsythia ovata]|uniref:Uncharacterized protein n=1 Tax=Forsythia ovata TaxID=205694 RepID=A0ABD1SLR5_9LAMI